MRERPGSPSLAAAAPRKAVVALAKIEAIRTLRHPVTVVASVLLVGFWLTAYFVIGTGRYPVLQEIDHDTAIGTMILLGGAALIVGNLAVLRGHRDGTTNLSRVLILADHARTVAHLIAVVPVAVLAAVLVVARIIVLAAWTGAAGRPNPFELAAGPASVLLLGALGVLLGRLTRSAVAAPLALLVLLANLVALEPLTNGRPTMWLSPQGGPALAMPVPVSMLGRPAGAHLVYLLGSAALLAAAAVVRAGGRSVRVVVAGVAALAGVLAGGAVQLSGPDPDVLADRAAAVTHPSRFQTCRRLDQVTYCTFAGFGRWVPAWNTIVQGVVAQVPASARPERLAVRQHVVILAAGNAATDENPEPGDSGGAAGGRGPEGLLADWRADDAAAGTPGAVGVGTQWGDGRSAAGLAGRVAYRLVTGRVAEAQVAERAELTGVSACGGVGVLVVWLAGQASARSADGLRDLVENPDGRGMVTFDENELFPGVTVPAVEVEVAMRALDRPHADIAARVQESWDTLAAPGTTTARAAELLGLPAPSAASVAHRPQSADPACR